MEAGSLNKWSDLKGYGLSRTVDPQALVFKEWAQWFEGFLDIGYYPYFICFNYFVTSDIFGGVIVIFLRNLNTQVLSVKEVIVDRTPFVSQDKFINAGRTIVTSLF